MLILKKFVPRLLEQNDVISLQGRNAENVSRVGRWNGLHQPGYWRNTLLKLVKMLHYILTQRRNCESICTLMANVFNVEGFRLAMGFLDII